jgi:hypothetical protein
MSKFPRHELKPEPATSEKPDTEQEVTQPNRTRKELRFVDEEIRVTFTLELEAPGTFYYKSDGRFTLYLLKTALRGTPPYRLEATFRYIGPATITSEAPHAE